MLGWALLIITFVLLHWRSRGKQCKTACDLSTRVAVITGGVSGIGRETAIGLAKHNCQVVIADVVDGEQAVRDIQRVTNNDRIAYLPLDLGSKHSVEQFAQAIKTRYGRLDILVNNAGLVCSDDSKARTQQGWEVHCGVHFLGPCYLAYLLWDLLSKSDRMRLVNVSSIAHYVVRAYDLKSLEKRNTGPWQQFLAYSFSKLLVIHLTRALARKVAAVEEARVTCVHPGFVRTPITSRLGWIHILLQPIAWLLFVSAKTGAQSSLNCVLETSGRLENGGYYSDCGLAKASALARSSLFLEESMKMAQSELGIGHFFE